MEQPRRGYLERAYAISLLVFAQKAGLGSEAVKIFKACAAVNGTSFGDWSRAHDELEGVLHERNISEPDLYGSR